VDLRVKTKISKLYRFESAHYLPYLPSEHRCRNLHGHNYSVVVTIEGPVLDNGFIMDFADLDTLVLPLIQTVDHRLLNEVEGLSNPTAELIAQWFLDRIPVAASVQLYENADSWVEVSRC
jgi:6-pyruvoyltetrahydropterin/6-carboxytetrahydropterin synthase